MMSAPTVLPPTLFHFSMSAKVTLEPGGKSWLRGRMPPSSASCARYAASGSTVFLSAALSAEQPFLSHC